MNKKIVSNILLIGGGLTLIAGVGTYFYQQYLLTDYLCYGIKGFKIKQLKFDSVISDLNLSIDNKGDLSIGLEKMSMKIFANGVPIATINQDISESIKPLSVTTLPITVSFNPKEIVGQALNIVTLTSLRDIKFRFKGKATIKKWGFPIPIPFDFEYTISEMMAPSGTSMCEDKSKKN